MRRRNYNQALVRAKVMEREETANLTMWLLGSFPLIAIAAISILMLNNL